MKIKIFPIFFIIIFLIIFLILYKGLENPNVYAPKVDPEKNIPVFTAKIFSTNNKINSEKIFTGDKFYLMNIWASWCAPCRKEHAYLMNLSKQKNIEIIGLNYKDKYENAKNFLSESNNPYSFIFLDKDGTIAIEWGAYGVPESFLIYKNKIIKKIIGPLDENLLLEIKKIIQ
jgi:cytochrome c biogenesis protein CcmG/thiol:disulfide interchange protein DsbE